MIDFRYDCLMKAYLPFLLLFSCGVAFSQTEKTTSQDSILVVIDEPAEFPGGINQFHQYLVKNMRYPKEAQRLGVEGRVFVQFIVEKDGTINEVKVVKGIGAGCDAESIRVISEMPNWIPGKDNGEVVRQKMIQALQFKFAVSKEEKKKLKKRKRG